MLVHYSQKLYLLAKILFHDAPRKLSIVNPSGICCYMLNMNSILHRTIDENFWNKVSDFFCVQENLPKSPL